MIPTPRLLLAAGLLALVGREVAVEPAAAKAPAKT